MRSRRSAMLSTVRTATASVLTALVLTGWAASPSPASADPGSRSTVTASTSTTGLRPVDITARDGVVLKANVIAPTAAGRHPAIVFVSSWGLNDLEYLAQATAFAQRGYVVLSYTPRGFWASGGEIDTAGPADIADVSDVIDWLVSHAAVDTAHIGLSGASYGAGIALIASAFDTRIRAVVALSAWTDLVASLYGNDTRRPQAVDLLKVAAQVFGHPSAELTDMLNSYFANDNIAQVTAWGRARSAGTYLAAINRNHPAIMIANAYGDSLFPPNQLVDFFGRLTGSKRLELAPGDHIVVEGTGLVGLPNHVWDSAYRWFDRYLAGVPNGIDEENPVVLRRLGTTAVQSYPDWAHISTAVRRFHLGPPTGLVPTGGLSTGPVDGDWSDTITAGTDTTAGAGVPLLTNGFTALTGIAPTDWLPTVNRAAAGVWESPPLAADLAIRGAVTLHLRISAPGQGTVVAYLYDTDATDNGRLIDVAPATWLSPTGTLEVPFPATAYDLPAGHRLALVVDTVDPLYLGANTKGARISVTDGSSLEVPVE